MDSALINTGSEKFVSALTPTNGGDAALDDNDWIDLDIAELVPRLNASIELLIREHHSQLLTKLKSRIHQSPDSLRDKATRSQWKTNTADAGVEVVPAGTSSPGLVPAGPRQAFRWHIERLVGRRSTNPLEEGEEAKATKEPGSPRRLQAKISIQHSASQLSIGRPTLTQFVRGAFFDRISGVFIVINALFLGVRASVMGSLEKTEEPLAMLALTYMFTMVFLVELVLRMVGNGMEFFRHDVFWNMFDLIIVLASTAQVFFDNVLNMESSHLSILGVMRVFRILRVVHVIRKVALFRPLILLVSSILGTLADCLWAFVLLSMILYMFSIAFTDVATRRLYGRNSCLDSGCHVDSELKLYFGTLQSTVNTLFQCICGGVSWGQALDALLGIGGSGWIHVTLFLLYISFTYFAFLNVVTALFCQHAVEHAIANEDKVIMLLLELDEMNQSEDSPPGIITRDDLEEFMSDERVKAQFAILGIDTGDSGMMYSMLDTGESNQLSVEDFVRGCMKLRGPAQRTDVLFIFSELMNEFQNLQDMVRNAH